MESPPRKAALTCLHGFSQRGDSWDELAALVPGAYRWLAPDLQGTTMVEVEAELLDLWRREGVERTHLLGYSQGGRVALFVASRRPERLLSLATIGAHAGFEGEARRRRLAEDRALADRIEREGIDWFAAYWAALPMFAGLTARGKAVQARLDGARRSHHAARLAATLRGLGAGATEPFWDRLERIDVPTLLIAGAEDERYVAFGERLRAAISGSELAIVPEAGHAAHLEQPHAVAALLVAHLARAASRRATPGSRRSGP
jgi:2-succinyl-6-hydroxy-2,4-cyclohexadiene-1-carboxylate synthase